MVFVFPQTTDALIPGVFLQKTGLAGYPFPGSDNLHLAHEYLFSVLFFHTGQPGKVKDAGRKMYLIKCIAGKK
jgi:hypothetical protein